MNIDEVIAVSFSKSFPKNAFLLYCNIKTHKTAFRLPLYDIITDGAVSCSLLLPCLRVGVFFLIRKLKAFEDREHFCPVLLQCGSVVHNQSSCYRADTAQSQH